MTIWIIEPKDPLIFRDGRPFNANPGARASSLSFPFPSTIAGAVRTKAGLGSDGIFQKSKIDEVKKESVKGPFLVEIDEDSKITNWLMPAPQDAVLLESSTGDKTEAAIKKLIPITLPDGAFTDFTHPIDSSNSSPKLLLLGMSPFPKSILKPHNKAPKFWYLSKLEDWLLEAKNINNILISEFGHNGPTQETRTHVKIEPESQTAKDGALFQTQGLEFIHKSQSAVETKSFSALKHLALALETTANISDGLANLGGERRLVAWNKTSEKLPFSETFFDLVVEQIIQLGTCRLMLLTPGYFEHVCNPAYLLNEIAKDPPYINPELKAVAVARPQVVSGWDFAKGKAKPTRRLAPAGTVFFLKFDLSKSNSESIKQWCEDVWLESVSDDAQSRLDGFGLAILGTWSENINPMTVEEIL